MENLLQKEREIKLLISREKEKQAKLIEEEKLRDAITKVDSMSSEEQRRTLAGNYKELSKQKCYGCNEKAEYFWRYYDDFDMRCKRCALIECVKSK